VAAALHGILAHLWRGEQSPPQGEAASSSQAVREPLEIDLQGDFLPPSSMQVGAATAPGSKTRASTSLTPSPKVPGELVAQSAHSGAGRSLSNTTSATSTNVASTAEHATLDAPRNSTSSAPSVPPTEARSPNGDHRASVGKPRLSLAELGYGTPQPDALEPYLDVNITASAQSRLDQNLAQGVIDRDRDRSNGIEGPVTEALHKAAMAVVVPTSLSKIAIIVGGNGKLADVEIISTNRDARALATLSNRLKTLLANQTIRVPNGRAVEFIYEIKSDVLLPSGRAPGFGVEVLGLPLKTGRADNSTKLSILTPKFKFGPVSEPDPERNGKVTQTLPQLSIGLSVVAIDGDLVDVGANERQVVHTRLIRQRVL
jgi:hypothetical protein